MYKGKIPVRKWLFNWTENSTTWKWRQANQNLKERTIVFNSDCDGTAEVNWQINSLNH